MTDYICVGCDRRCYLFQPTEELLLSGELVRRLIRHDEEEDGCDD